MPYQFSPSLTVTASQSAEVTVVVRVSTNNDQAPLVAARVVDAVRTAVDIPGTTLTVSVPQPRTAERGELRIQPAARQVWQRGDAVELTRMEFDLLLHLARRPGRVHLRTALLSELWGLPHGVETRTLDVHVRRLRRKLGPAATLITTVRGVGYRLDGADRVTIEE
ncbi:MULTISPECIES: winged helix-turn-helix domain-containing protein [unclassified Kutzneria]|uniref:winged helix-turn-helix domain-containing protein n=1 Tax=unclassified Kutzneria TaxID=2621979 RepID=UPI0004AEA740|nr:winged helix-turn-helix domain-containing protein [Kutzneria sp. 744]